MQRESWVLLMLLLVLQAAAVGCTEKLSKAAGQQMDVVRALTIATVYAQRRYRMRAELAAASYRGGFSFLPFSAFLLCVEAERREGERGDANSGSITPKL